MRPAFLIGVSANLGKLQLLTDSFPVEVKKAICAVSTEHHCFCKRGLSLFGSSRRVFRGCGVGCGKGSHWASVPAKVTSRTGVLVIVPVPWDSWVGWQFCLNTRCIPQGNAPFCASELSFKDSTC